MIVRVNMTAIIMIHSSDAGTQAIDPISVTVSNTVLCLLIGLHASKRPLRMARARGRNLHISH